MRRVRGVRARGARQRRATVRRMKSVRARGAPKECDRAACERPAAVGRVRGAGGGSSAARATVASRRRRRGEATTRRDRPTDLGRAAQARDVHRREAGRGHAVEREVDAVEEAVVVGVVRRAVPALDGGVAIGESAKPRWRDGGRRGGTAGRRRHGGRTDPRSMVPAERAARRRRRDTASFRWDVARNASHQNRQTRTSIENAARWTREDRLPRRLRARRRRSTRSRRARTGSGAAPRRPRGASARSDRCRCATGAPRATAARRPRRRPPRRPRRTAAPRARRRRHPPPRPGRSAARASAYGPGAADRAPRPFGVTRKRRPAGSRDADEVSPCASWAGERLWRRRIRPSWRARRNSKREP